MTLATRIFPRTRVTSAIDPTTARRGSIDVAGPAPHERPVPATSRARLWSLLALLLGGCAASRGTPPAPPPAAGDSLAGRPVVPNHEAKPGDVTTCPYSGRRFVVEADSPRLEHRGRSYVLCSEEARDAVAADPERYLGRPDP